MLREQGLQSLAEPEDGNKSRILDEFDDEALDVTQKDDTSDTRDENLELDGDCVFWDDPQHPSKMDRREFMLTKEASMLSRRRFDVPAVHRPFYTGIVWTDLGTHCMPHGLFHNKYNWPLLLCVVACALTISGSFSCSYFVGADIGFTGGRYGLWTLEDETGKCQLWSVLFYSYHLGMGLRFARVASMFAMLCGLAILTTMAQAMQNHAVGWSIGLCLVLLFLVSVATTSIFNIWIVWGVLTYTLFVLVVRCIFVHPVARKISDRGRRIIAGIQVFCSISSFQTLLVMTSRYCTCATLSSTDLGGRLNDSSEACEAGTNCHLSIAGYTFIFAGIFWAGAAIATIRVGVQPETLIMSRPIEHFAHYSRESITTRVKRGVNLALSSFGSSANEDDAAAEKNAEETWQHPPRNWGQKVCCDYRVTKRDRRDKCIFWTFRFTLGLMVALYVFLAMLMIGARLESNRAQRAPSTTHYFTMDPVCAYNPLAPRSEPMRTFSNKDQAVASGYLVAHCGECGYCSNMADIQTYVETRKTIAKSAKECGATSFLGSFEDLVYCLQDRIDFSHDCTVCWAENMLNTEGAGSNGWMNQCLYCDEKMSGPGFVTCSGVARRRLGIVSEIERNPEEQCRRVDVDWVTVDFDTLSG